MYGHQSARCSRRPRAPEPPAARHSPRAPCLAGKPSTNCWLPRSSFSLNGTSKVSCAGSSGTGGAGTTWDHRHLHLRERRPELNGRRWRLPRAPYVFCDVNITGNGTIANTGGAVQVYVAGPGQGRVRQLTARLRVGGANVGKHDELHVQRNRRAEAAAAAIPTPGTTVTDPSPPASSNPSVTPHLRPRELHSDAQGHRLRGELRHLQHSHQRGQHGVDCGLHRHRLCGRFHRQLDLHGDGQERYDELLQLQLELRRRGKPARLTPAAPSVIRSPSPASTTVAVNGHR